MICGEISSPREESAAAFACMLLLACVVCVMIASLRRVVHWFRLTEVKEHHMRAKMRASSENPLSLLLDKSKQTLLLNRTQLKTNGRETDEKEILLLLNINPF